MDHFHIEIEDVGGCLHQVRLTSEDILSLRKLEVQGDRAFISGDRIAMMISPLAEDEVVRPGIRPRGLSAHPRRLSLQMADGSQTEFLFSSIGRGLRLA